jgi:hypothetical protein
MRAIKHGLRVGKQVAQLIPRNLEIGDYDDFFPSIVARTLGTMNERPNPNDPALPEDPAPIRDPEPGRGVPKPAPKKPKVTPLDENKNIEDGIEVNET